MNNYPSINHSDESEGKKDTEQLRKFVAENIKLKQFYEVAEGNASEQEMIREIYDTICDIVCFPREQITIKGTSLSLAGCKKPVPEAETGSYCESVGTIGG